MPFLLAEILDFQGSAHLIGVGSLSYLLLLVGFLELVIYVTIKTNPDNKPSIVYISSALCTVSSVVISWKSELFLKGKV